MAFGKAIAGSIFQHIGGSTCDWISLVVKTVCDLIPHPLEATVGDLRLRINVRRKFLRQMQHRRCLPINVWGRLQVFRHLVRLSPAHRLRHVMSFESRNRRYRMLWFRKINAMTTPNQSLIWRVLRSCIQITSRLLGDETFNDNSLPFAKTGVVRGSTNL